MSANFFGLFLLEQGYVTVEHLTQSVKLQKRRNRKIGYLAVEKGYLSQTQLEKVLKAQRNEDLMFGELAIMLGVLSDEQKQELLLKQQSDHLYLGEALMEIDAIQFPDLEKALESYLQQQERNKNVVSRTNNDIDYYEQCHRLTTIVCRYIFRLTGLTARTKEWKTQLKGFETDEVIFIDFPGAHHFSVNFYLPQPINQIINDACKPILKPSQEEVRPNRYLGIFANIVSGIYATGLTETGWHTTPSIPMVEHYLSPRKISISDLEKTNIAIITTPYGKIAVRVQFHS